MKLACLARDLGLPIRRPFRPQASIRRPAESSAGSVHTEPRRPPGWFALRQRTISSIAALPAAGSPGARRWVARTTTSVAARDVRR